MKNDTSLIWKELQQLITLKYKNNRKFNIVIVKCKNAANPRNIANNFLINTGPSLSKPSWG